MIVDGFSAAEGRILDVYAEAQAAFAELGLAEQLRRVLTTTVPAEKSSQFLELCYANHDALPAAVIEAAADVGSFAAVHGFYELGIDERGLRMVQVLRGEAVADVPAPREQYLPPVPEDTTAGGAA